MTDRFWRRKSLEEMTPAEWESLCDGCAKCCLHKIEDEDTGEVFYTNVACRLLDLKSLRCTKYQERQRYVPDCAVLNPENVHMLSWMPETCAYRLLAEGKDLADWHPLISGRPGQSIHSRLRLRGISRSAKRGVSCSTISSLGSGSKNADGLETIQSPPRRRVFAWLRYSFSFALVIPT